MQNGDQGLEQTRARLRESGAFDAVNRAEHYNQTAIEVIDLIELFALDFHLGNVIKYVLRSPYKAASLQDLQKARFYLDRKISMMSETRVQRARRIVGKISEWIAREVSKE